MNVTISPLDPTDGQSVEAALALCNAARAVDSPHEPPLCRYRFRAGLSLAVTGTQRQERLAARGPDGLVGYLSLPRRQTARRR